MARKFDGRGGQLVATSYDSEDVLHEKYDNAAEVVTELCVRPPLAPRAVPPTYPARAPARLRAPAFPSARAKVPAPPPPPSVARSYEADVDVKYEVDAADLFGTLGMRKKRQRRREGRERDSGAGAYCARASRRPACALTR